jgi:hypothetical protein
MDARGVDDDPHRGRPSTAANEANAERVRESLAEEDCFEGTVECTTAVFCLSQK